MVKRKPPPTPTITRRHVLGERFSDPDLVDRIFDYVVELIPEVAERRDEVTRALRDEFGGRTGKVYVRKKEPRGALVDRVLALFDGRNATEVARRLNISRPTVYRMLKQAGQR